ncbi:cytochrome c [Compostibacter hankyongensis]|uniref:Cytochrome c domain-containing protein n=1 Tax=Compostibacter hankyongensis TaxID=1007089 RepID=A0ABP8FIB0_9BACT
MKTILKVALLCVGAGLYACGGGSSSNTNTDSSSAPVSNAGSDESSTTMNNASSSLDLNAKSDSKGVGKYTDKEIKLGPLDAALAKKGKDLFQTKCAICHKPTDERLIGPGLKNITNIRTPQWILNMMSDPTKMTQEDPIAKALLDEFKTQMTFQGVNEEECRAILEFLRQNDGAK